MAWVRGGGGAMGLFGLGGCYRTDWVRGGCVMGVLGLDKCVL